MWKFFVLVFRYRRFVLVKKYSKKGLNMLRGVRFSGQVAMMVLGLHMLSTTGSQLQAQDIEGESRIFDPSQLEKDDQVRKSGIRLQEAVAGVKAASDQGKAKVKAALQVFDSKASRENEALLIKAIEEAISLQHAAHKNLQAATKSAGTALAFSVSEVTKRKAFIGKQVEGYALKKTGALNRAIEAEKQLMELADRIDLEGKDQLGPELDSKVRMLLWMQNQEKVKAEDAGVMHEEAGYVFGEMDAELRSLRGKQYDLAEREVASKYTIERLVTLAADLEQDVSNRQILDSVRSLNRAIAVDKNYLPETGHLRLPRRKSKRVKPESRVADSGRKSGIDILRKLKSRRATELKANPKKKISDGVAHGASDREGRPGESRGYEWRKK